MPKIFYKKKLLYKFRGMTIPPIGIFIKNDFKNDSDLLQHELKHWQQYKRMGLLLFYLRYFFQLIFIGYDTMPMEVEAREKDLNKFNHRENYW